MNCQDDRRRTQVRAHQDQSQRRDLNGLDYVEVGSDQTTLTAYFIGKLPPQLRAGRPDLVDHLRVEGGRRVRAIQIVGVEPFQEQDPEIDDALVVRVDRPGDFSTYTLRLVGIEGIDPRYDRAPFSFKVDCPSDLDCATADACPPRAFDEPAISYLAKDYASFRQLILDRLALTMPEWQERRVPDLGIALTEVLAYVADHLSYTQDAVATEAYLDSARQRISVRRHARLVDYLMHDGCNARAWLCLGVSDPTFDLDLARAYFITRLVGTEFAAQSILSDDAVRQLPPEVAFEVFEPVSRAHLTLRQARNKIHFYTWGQRDCCLPKGATNATLVDAWAIGGAAAGYPASQKQAAPQPLDIDSLPRALQLQAGDVLILEEVVGPKTGQQADADPAHRHAVRLTRVTRAIDALVSQEQPVNGATVSLPTPLLEVEWAEEDALPFALCVSALGPAPLCPYLETVSVARGNVILVDHGRTARPPEFLGIVPLDRAEAPCTCEGEPGDVIYWPGRFRPRLERAALTFRQPLLADNPARNEWISAARLLGQSPRGAVPQMTLIEVPPSPDDQGQLTPLFDLHDLVDPSELVRRMREPSDQAGARARRKLSAGTEKALSALPPGELPSSAVLDAVRSDLQALLRSWEPRVDLLASGPDDRHFVVEIDNEGRGHLRFGDGELGEQPPAGSAFYADYRVGNGTRGNVGGEAIAHLVLIGLSVSGAGAEVRNPLPATGGGDPEPLAEVKLYAPHTFRQRLERAIIAEDYARIAQREAGRALQQAAARLVWTGSWYEAEIAVDPRGSKAPADRLVQSIDACLERYRRMGHDLRVEAAHTVALDIELAVYVKAAYLRGHVQAALLELFSNRLGRGGKPGFFHPDRFTFGDGVQLSQIVAAAQAVDGVESARVTKLQRRFDEPNQEIENGVLPLGPFEIAQVDNDPTYPEHGRFTLVLQGGR
ncbi:MAG: putative baseplate assembly protein [Anaerolineae bacterium]